MELCIRARDRSRVSKVGTYEAQHYGAISPCPLPHTCRAEHTRKTAFTCVFTSTMPEDYEVTGSGVNDKVGADIGLLMIGLPHLSVTAGQPLVLPRPRRERIRVPLLEQVRRVSSTIDGAHDALMTAGMGATITRTPTILSTIIMGRAFPSTSLPAARSERATVNRTSEVVGCDSKCLARTS